MLLSLLVITFTLRPSDGTIICYLALSSVQFTLLFIGCIDGIFTKFPENQNTRREFHSKSKVTKNIKYFQLLFYNVTKRPSDVKISNDVVEDMISGEPDLKSRMNDE